MQLNDNLWILTEYGGQKGAVAWNPENDRNTHRYKIQDYKLRNFFKVQVRMN